MRRGKKIKKNKEEIISSEENNEENRKGLSWIIWGIGILAVLFVVFYYVFQGWGIIKYNGLKFTMEKYGDKLYLYHYEYYFKGPENQIYKNNVYLRYDPRKNNIPVEGEIIFSKVPPIYISVKSDGLKSCDEGVIAIATLSQFIAHNLLNVKGAVPDEIESKEKNITFANCTSHPENSVVLIQKGEKTEIKKENNCYMINVNNCEIQQAVEKFIVQSLVDAKKRFNP